MSQKVVFWLAPNEILIPADQVPGAIAETFYPPVTRDSALNDPNAVERLKAEREHSQKLSEQYPNLPDDYKFSVGDLSSYLAGLSLEIEVRHGSPTSIEAAEYTIGWYDATLSAAMWFGLISVGSQEAAMLLCQFNPLDDRSTPQEDTTSETGPEDFKRLLRVFEDVANGDSQPRTLSQWLTIARDKHLRYHSWIDDYAKAVLLTTSTNEATPKGSAVSSALGKKTLTPRAVTKREILSVPWPMPPDAPPLENILSELPKWVQSAYKKVGRPGKGAEGSHLWNPAQLAVCLAVTTPHKRWACKKTALTNFLRGNFSDHLEEWNGSAEHI